MRITELFANGPAEVRPTRDGCLVIRVPMLVKRHSAYKRIIGVQLQPTSRPVATEAPELPPAPTSPLPEATKPASPFESPATLPPATLPPAREPDAWAAR